MKRHVKDLFDLTGKTGGLPFHFPAAGLISLNKGIRFFVGAFSVCLDSSSCYEKLVVGAWSAKINLPNFSGT